ncbi:MAG: penicillin-binding protein 2 [Candidatus Saccharimonadales bacterium]
MKFELLKGSRSRILAAVIFIVMAVFVVRLFYLQVIQHDYYVGLANEEQQAQFKLPASRGLIYAMNGSQPVQLVLNETVYTVFADPVVVDDKAKIVSTLKEVAGGNVRTDFDKLLDKTDSRYQIIATKVTRVQADKIKAAELHGIGFQEVSQRVYPEGQLGAQILGFVNTEGKGNYGIESGLDDRLKGKDGLLKTVKDVSNVPLTIGTGNINIPKIDGDNVVLSIDRNVQSHTEQALAAALERTGAKAASAIVMDPQTGKILAMANLPTYNPGEYNKVEDPAAFNNATISAPYEPGSDVKTFTMATGIDKGVVKATDTYNNTDFIKVDDRTITNATLGHTGIITFQTALTWSLNTGFVTVAERLGDGKEITLKARQTMYEYFHDRLGLGEKTGVELANEAKGIVISPDEADGNAVRYSNMAFGQGLDATMIQVASGFSAIVNGGSYYKPTVLAGTIDTSGTYKPNPTPTPIRTNVVNSSTSDQIREMTHLARSSAFGRADKQGYYIGGKTGTSQVIVNGQYSNNETVGTYLGYGGVDQPKYVIMVQVSGKNQELQGARDALPIFTDISNWMLDYLKIQPKG